MSEREPTVKELFNAARTGMIWRGKSIDNSITKESSAKMWIEEEDITSGIFAVKSAACYDNYVKWCKERGLTEKSMLGIVNLGKFLSDRFKVTNFHNSRHYYLNKDLPEDNDAKKKRQEDHLNRKAKRQNKKSKET